MTAKTPAKYDLYVSGVVSPTFVVLLWTIAKLD